MPKTSLPKAVRDALRSGPLAGAAVIPGATLALLGMAAPAFAQDAESPSDQLETIVVTGSRIRRVDLETASPVVTIDKAAIEKSGKLTIGDLVQELPAVSGAATNPRVNNGGGTGASTIELRGLTALRTLVLVNGRRVIGNGGAPDINSIPANLVERIEVLKDGASAVYGSEAIGGVVNFILRTDYQGAEFTVDYGISDRDDGERQGSSFTIGHSSDRGSIVGGVNYNHFDSISSAVRDFSKDAVYLYSGYVTKLGSGRNPNGRIGVPPNLLGQFGCATVTRLPGQDGTSLDDYRCYVGATDAFNYQSQNLILTPQERTSAFLTGNYKLTDNVEAYLNVFHTKTTSKFAIAPLPFDANVDAVTVSRDNYYNPFGIDYGVGAQNFQTRFTGLGQRTGNFTNSIDQGIVGMKGLFGDTSWSWDASYNYGHSSLFSFVEGYVFYEGLRQALGPSFDDNGVIRCGTPGAPIAGCIPFNIFDQANPDQVALLSNYSATPYTNLTYILRQFEVNASGELFELPAGVVSLAVGASHRKEYSRFAVDFIAITRGAGGTCFISQEACATPLVGDMTVKEAYGEIFVPILKDAPFAQTLNLIVGTRHSDYSTFGGTTNSKFAIEWRPIEDVLLRGTVSEVFRAPNLSQLFAGAAGGAPPFADPCIGYQGGHANACQNVPIGYPGTGLGQTTAVVSGSVAAGVDLKPEHGKSFDFGIVYDPSWIDGLSVNLDVWRIYLNDTIVAPSPQLIANLCYADDNSPFCSLIHRTTLGDVQFINTPTINLGRLDTKGVDIGFKYRLPETPIGNFTFGFDSTYIARYDNDQVPELSTDPVIHVAGHFNIAFGNYARWRALSSINWNLGNWDASWRIKYVGPIAIGNADIRQGQTADAGLPAIEVQRGAQVENNVAVGYNFEAINTRVDFGIDNVFDKQPPLLFNNNVVNANTDVNTYDTVGRFYFARVSVKF